MEKNENGYSDFSFENRKRATERRNGACPGTGDSWEGDGLNGNISDISTENGGMGECGNMKCSERQLGMVYSPYQCWRMLYNTDEALKKGTLFEELYKPLEEGH